MASQHEYSDNEICAGHHNDFHLCGKGLVWPPRGEQPIVFMYWHGIQEPVTHGEPNARLGGWGCEDEENGAVWVECDPERFLYSGHAEIHHCFVVQPAFLNEYDSEKPYPPGGVEGKGKRAHVEEGVLVVNCSPAQQPQETCTPLPALTPTPVCPAEIEEPQNGDTFFVGEEVTFSTSASPLRSMTAAANQCFFLWDVIQGKAFPLRGWGPDFQTTLLSEGTVEVQVVGASGETDSVEVEARPRIILSVNPSRISRNSPSSQISEDDYTAVITVTTDPAGFEDDVLVCISRLSPEDHNTSMGSLSKVSSNTWEYEGCEEPFSEVHPDLREKLVWFKASMGSEPCCGTEGPEVSLRVVCVFEHLTTAPVITLNPGEPGAGAEYHRAYDFIWDKYGPCLNTTGGLFASVTLADTYTVWHPLGRATASTSIFDNVKFGIQTFDTGENFCASTIGHELKHTVGALNQDECVTYTWEVDHAGCTGLQGDELQRVEEMQEQECN